MIGLVTDSNAQLPSGLVERYGVEVVPLTVTVDGEAFLEGVDLDADAFYDRFADGRMPEVSTSQPSPGRFARAFSALADRGAEQILAVHIGSVVSGTLNSARLAAAEAAIPVRLVDTGTASFGVACCVWEAGEALAGGASLEEAAEIAASVGETVETVFTVEALDLARSGGRLADVGDQVEAPGIPVLTMNGGQMRVVDHARDVHDAARIMVERVLAGPERSALRVGLGIADASARPWWRALEERLSGASRVAEVVRYRIGPSVGAHTGPGTAGVYYYPSRVGGVADAQSA